MNRAEIIQRFAQDTKHHPQLEVPISSLEDHRVLKGLVGDQLIKADLFPCEGLISTHPRFWFAEEVTPHLDYDPLQDLAHIKRRLEQTHEVLSSTLLSKETGIPIRRVQRCLDYLEEEGQVALTNSYSARWRG